MSLFKQGDPIPNFDMETRTKSGRSVWLNVSTIVTQAVAYATTHRLL